MTACDPATCPNGKCRATGECIEPSPTDEFAAAWNDAEAHGAVPSFEIEDLEIEHPAFIPSPPLVSTKDDDANPKDRLGVKKAPLSLVPMAGLILESYAFAEGARKYGEFNWRRKNVRRRVYLEAILRHTIAALAGEDIDPDTIVRDGDGNVTFPGIPHEAKIRACCGIVLDAWEIGCLIDDRFEKDPSAAVIARFMAGDYHQAAANLTRTPARTLDEVRAEQATD